MDGRAKTYTAAGALLRTASANGSAVDMRGSLELGNKRQVLAHLSVGGQSGTTLDVHFEESANGSTGWADITGAAFTQVGAALSEQDLRFKISLGYIRAVWTIAGTNYSFSVTVTALRTQAVS